MQGDQDLNLTIRAKDEATDTINKVQKSLGEVSQGMKSTGKASDGMTASVFKGVLAYDALKKAVGLSIDFLKSSVNESIEAGRVMQQVETNVRNAGLAYDLLAPKIKAYSENAVQLGFDDETAAQSLSKLLIVTKDYEQARALANLSMDLARNKNIGLEEATKAILMVTQGNTKALREYGIEMGDNATTADILNEAQKKLKDSAIGFASTAAGQIATLGEEYSNIKQQIGDQLTPAIKELFDLIKENKETIVSLADAFVYVGKGVAFAIKGFVSLGKSIAFDLSQKAEKAADSLNFVAKGLNKFGILSDDSVKKTEGWAQSWHETTTAVGDDLVALYSDVPKLTKTLDGTSDALGKVKNRADSAGTSIEKLQKIASGKNDIATEIVDQQKKITDLEKELGEKSRDLYKSKQENSLTVQEQFDAEQEISKMKTDLEKEKKALETVKTSTPNIIPQLKEAERRASLTEFERKIEDIGVNAPGLAREVSGGTIINFHFNGSVAGDDGIKQIINDTIGKLNRQASLKTMAGA